MPEIARKKAGQVQILGPALSKNIDNFVARVEWTPLSSHAASDSRLREGNEILKKKGRGRVRQGEAEEQFGQGILRSAKEFGRRQKGPPGVHSCWRLASCTTETSYQ